MKIYVASSWKNEKQPAVVQELRAAGHEVYDFKSNAGFGWSMIDPAWEKWTVEQYREALSHPLAIKGFLSDQQAMEWADCCVLVLPCGASAHLEAGWFLGQDKNCFILLDPSSLRPELMYALPLAEICSSVSEILYHLPVES